MNEQIELEARQDFFNEVLYRNRIPPTSVPQGTGAWHKVKMSTGNILKFRLPGAGVKAMKEWCAENTKHRWSSFKGDFFFENSHDALWFTLRWI